MDSLIGFLCVEVEDLAILLGELVHQVRGRKRRPNAESQQISIPDPPRSIWSYQNQLGLILPYLREKENWLKCLQQVL